MTVLDNNKVVIGLSGGVDSTASALILKEKGYEVIGLYFDIHGDNEKGQEKAKKVAGEIGIKLIIKDVRDEFSNCVIDNFKDEYAKGRTPNPCIMCNPNIKFKTLVEVADQEGAKHIATGHYAQTGYSEAQGCHVLKLPVNAKKDQTYMMYRLPKETIERIIFPLGMIESKDDTRQFARDNHMSNAEDKDSQEICFIPDDETYKDYLDSHGIISKPGKFIDRDGNVVGEHKGITNYTYGQRKGLGIALGKTVFVTDIDSENNTVTLGDNEDLFSNKLLIEDVIFTATGSDVVPEFLKDVKLQGKIRYAAKRADVSISEVTDDGIILEFKESQRAATPGQSVVLYLDNEIVGGGFIKKSIK